MPFANAVQQAIDSAPINRPRRIILEFLLANARGRGNAQSWEAISVHLHQHGLHMAKETFQTGILASTRRKDIFIGSSRNGFYIIENRDDALAAMAFIQQRLASHFSRLQHLNDLVIEEGWPELPLWEPDPPALEK